MWSIIKITLQHPLDPMIIAGHGRWMGDGDQWGSMGINLYPFIPRWMNGWWMGDEWMTRGYYSSPIHHPFLSIPLHSSILGWMGKSWSPFISIPHSSAMPCNRYAQIPWNTTCYQTRTNFTQRVICSGTFCCFHLGGLYFLDLPMFSIISYTWNLCIPTWSDVICCCLSDVMSIFKGKM